ncbi:hypothetical protein PGTUg99_030485 [Puccinia graminis f. sp. tritici]|uniref:Uncharacterized protein n=1 Tax=Puccinia graminis f. sp. tritici TaxID=56615 RepID=A0A5B0S858_PUCGR|nr:hypothetical protein PGTUg99_030485 [Puccinia graminis f. sp. tritici]
MCDSGGLTDSGGFAGNLRRNYPDPQVSTPRTPEAQPRRGHSPHRSCQLCDAFLATRPLQTPSRDATETDDAAGLQAPRPSGIHFLLVQVRRHRGQTDLMSSVDPRDRPRDASSQRRAGTAVELSSIRPAVYCVSALPHELLKCSRLTRRARWDLSELLAYEEKYLPTFGSFH